MGQPIEEPKGELTLYVKAMRPQTTGGVYAAVNHAWVQDRVAVHKVHCTYNEAEQIAAIHRRINVDQNAVAVWEGSVTL